MLKFNQLDVVILIVITFGIINGFFKGFISQLIGLGSFFIAIFISFKFFRIVEQFVVKHNIVTASLTTILALLITFVVSYLAIRLISSFAQRIIKSIGLGFINRLFGAFLGCILYILICSSILYYVNPILELGFQNVKKESKLLPYLSKSSKFIKSHIFGNKTFKDF